MSSQVNQAHVLLVAAEDGQEQVAITLKSDPGPVLTLTLAEARALATELIKAVNRAEVKANLKESPNLWRRSTDTRPRLLMAG